MNEWQDAIEGQPEPEFYPGSLIGYRQFDVRLVDSQYVLTSIHLGKHFRTSDWDVAQCGRNTRSEGPQGHRSPEQSCRCGYYVAYLPDALFSPLLHTYVRAVVETAGKIVLASKGYRAEKMRILGVATDYRCRDELSETYPGIPVVPLEDWDDLVERFPKSDYDSLVGMPVRELPLRNVKRALGSVKFNFDLSSAIKDQVATIQAALDSMTAALGKSSMSFKNLSRAYYYESDWNPSEQKLQRLIEAISTDTVSFREPSEFKGCSTGPISLDEMHNYSDNPSDNSG